MEQKQAKKWYKKKRYILPALALAGMVAFSGDSSTATQAPAVVPVQTQTVQTVKSTVSNPTAKEVSVPTQSNRLSNDNYYINSVGNKVHSPAYSDTIPQGASAKCRDGTYSFSQNRRGTCSHHGGVARWL